MKPLVMTPELLTETMNLLRSADHVDGLRLLADALDRKLTEPDAPSLEFLLGFAKPGPSFARRDAKAKRDRMLRAWRRTTCAEMSVNAAAGKAAQAMRTYLRERWNYDRKAGHGPDPAAAPLEAIAFALLADGKKLLSAETIRKALC